MSQASNTSGSDNDSIAPSSSISHTQQPKRKRHKANIVWTYCRKPVQGDEAKRTPKEQGARRIWYCKHEGCEDYSVTSTSSARHHLKAVHYLTLPDEDLSNVKRGINQDLQSSFSHQVLCKQQQEDQLVRRALKGAANKAAVQQALLRLIVQHDLPLSTCEWPELHTLVRAINYEATHCIWTSHQTVANQISKTFKIRQVQVKEALQQSQSLVHLTTDTWHSPNLKELQAITAHFVDSKGTLRKVLLDLPELPEGHSGVKVAPYVLAALETYGIKDRLGYITADNHGANDTLCESIHEQLLDWQPSKRRLRCVGHIINIAVQAFLFAKNKTAVDLAIEHVQSQSSQPLEDELVSLSVKDIDAGWIHINPLQKILTFVQALRKSDRLYNAFTRLAGKTIRAPNDTRWNSYLFTFEDALKLKAAYTTFVLEYPQFTDNELTAMEWQLVEQTVQFLQPFKEATKRCEGDYVTLDKVQLAMDSLVEHLKEQQDLHKANKSLTESIITCWYAFDKYYDLIDETGAYTAAILLHPNRRKAYLHLVWQALWIAPGIERARTLWMQYKQDNQGEVDDDTTTLSQYERFVRKIAAKQRNSKSGQQDEFERFINAPVDNIDMAVLDWWQEASQRHTYPHLSRMAIDVLSALAMSAESERVFSATRRTVTWSRARLCGRTIMQLECLKHWQRTGVVTNEFLIIGDDEMDIEVTSKDYSLTPPPPER